MASRLSGNTARMATAASEMEEPDQALEELETDSEELEEVFERARQRFDIAVLPQLEQRSLALMARRFIAIPGAQWEGDFGDPFDNAIKLEINLTKDGLEKIQRDYNDNRIVPDFRPAGGKGDEVSANTLDGLHRADACHFKSQQAFDNGFNEASAGGFGAYRLTNEWADPYDKDSDYQRINPGLVIADADQRVFFDPDSQLYDKSDARYAFVITAKQRTEFEEQYDGAISDWPDEQINPPYDWFSPDVVKVAEYYEVEDVEEKLFILRQAIAKGEERYWESEIDADELAQLKKMGWKAETRRLPRRRVHKYVMSGLEVVCDKGKLAGDRIPIVPIYGKRSFVDGIERWEGFVQSKMDIQRLYNAVVSRLAETMSMSPRDIPIFLSEQMPAHLADLWSRQALERHAYALVDPVIDPKTGEYVATGPIAKVEAPTVSGIEAALLQVARTELTDANADGADQVKANVSEEAMNVAAFRVDAKSGIYLDNMRQSVQCGGEIYLSMAADIYHEPDRVVETMTEDGNDGTATLVEAYTDTKTGRSGTRNDFTRGHYKVVVAVTEATATRRDKTVKSCMNLAAVAHEVGDEELAQGALLTATTNMDGEGMADLQAFARKKGIALGLIQPSEEEAAEMAQNQAAQDQQPDPQADYFSAKAEEARASAGEKQAGAVEKLAGAKLKDAQASVVGGPEAAPSPPDGLDQAHKIADIRKKTAEAHKLETEADHMPEKLKIEGMNALSNRLKAFGGGFAKLFGGGAE